MQANAALTSLEPLVDLGGFVGLSSWPATARHHANIAQLPHPPSGITKGPMLTEDPPKPQATGTASSDANQAATSRDPLGGQYRSVI
jgi:hypothetical protein